MAERGLGLSRVGGGAAMAEDGESRRDLEERTYEFARWVRRFVRTLPRTVSNHQDVKQLVRSSGSVGANYIEADEALSKKDLILRLKIARKEAKESRYWLRLVNTFDRPDTDQARDDLIQESTELVRILSAIIERLG
jgi:four helix bundle protein